MKSEFRSLFVAVSLIGLLTGCSKTYSGGDGSAVTVSGDGKQVSIKSGDGQTTVNSSMNQAYPAGFPVPQYPGSKISTNMAVNTASPSAALPGSQSIVMLNTGDKPEQVLQFYKEKLSAAGWKIDNTVDSVGTAAFVAASKDSAHFNVSVVSGTGDTIISLTLQ